MNLVTDLLWLIFFISFALQLPRLFLYGHNTKYSSWLKGLMIYHFAFGIVYYFLSRNGGGDAWVYWTTGSRLNTPEFVFYLLQGEGTRFVEALTFVPASIFGMSFFSTTMAYTFIGCIGIASFFAVTLINIPYNKIFYGYQVFPLIFFLPNLHFWSAGVGKDTLLFFSIGLVAFGLLNPLKRIPLIVLGLGLSIAVRPHITLFLLTAFGISYLFDGKITRFQRIFFSIVLLGAGLAILPSVLEFIKLDSLNLESISKHAEGQAGKLAEGSGSSVDLSSYPIPLKIITYLYRPLFFDAGSIGAFLSSLDNLILLILSITAFRYKPIRTYLKAPFIVKGFLLFGVLGTLAFSTSLGNLGIMIRQKNMFTPGILIYFMWCFSYRLYIERVLPYQAAKAKRLTGRSSLDMPTSDSQH